MVLSWEKFRADSCKRIFVFEVKKKPKFCTCLFSRYVTAKTATIKKKKEKIRNIVD